MSIFRIYSLFSAANRHKSMFLIKISVRAPLNTSVHFNIKMLVFTAVLFFGLGKGQAEPLTFTHDKNLESNDGYILLNWNNTEQTSVVLQQASQPTFENATTLYQGRNNSLMLSGLSDGTYYYRIRTSGSGWSDRAILKVSHYPVTQALLLFALGAIIFLSVVWVVIRGASDEP